MPQVESEEVEEYRRERLTAAAEKLEEARGLDVEQYERHRRELVLQVEAEVRAMRKKVRWKRRGAAWRMGVRYPGG